MHTDLMLRPHPFAEEPGIYPVRAGQTLLAMLREGAQAADLRETLRVEIGGHEVPRHLWAKVTPKAGVPIVVTAMPAGGSARKLVRTVLLVALTVFTGGMAAAGWTAFGLSAATTAALVGLVGSLVINALLPPPTPKLGGGGQESPGRWLALTGSSNRASPYGAIPLVVGESLIFPPHAALPYSETLGDTVYQRLMFDLGHGDEIEVVDKKIGDTDLSSFDDVEWEVTKTPTLYTSDVSEVAVSAVMSDSDTETRTTSSNVDEISLDIVFPQGLFGISSKGKTVTATADLTVEYRAAGTADPWVAVPITTPEPGAAPTRTSGLLVGALLTAASVPVKGGKDRNPFAVSVAWGVAQGQYEVRVTRGTTDWNGAAVGSRVGEDATWTVLRSIRHTDPSTTGTWKLCLRIKSSEQLNGTLDTFNCVVRQKIPVYDSGTETWSAATVNYNPAWVYHWLLKGAGGAFVTELADSRIDLDSLVAFADFCTTHDFEARGVLESQQTMGEFIREFLACALAAPTLRDGKYGVLFDDGSTTPTTLFSPINSRGFTASRPFIRLPHALRVEFRNPEAFWETDAILVLADGYSFNGVDAHGDASADPEPSLIETLTLRYSCDAFSAWRIGRYHLAQGKYRATQYGWETDIANLSVTRGDCVAMQHDVQEWGAGAGRIASIAPRTNHILHSNDFTNAAWVKDGVTVTANAVSGPGDVGLMDTITEDTSLGFHAVIQNTGIVDGLTYARSVIVKRGTARYAAFGVAASLSSAANTWIFDFDTGAFTTTGTSGAGQSIESLGDDTYRITWLNVSTTSNNSRMFVGVSTGPDRLSASYTGTGTLTVHVAKAQYELGTEATEYIDTTTAARSVATLTLDNRIETEEGTNYSVRIQASDGSMEVIGATPHSTDSETFYLTSVPTDGAVGDMAVLGETGSETAVLYVTGIQPGGDLSARLTAVAYSADVASYWADPPATIVSEITGTTYRDGPAPPTVDVVTDPDNDPDDDAGVHEPVVHIRIRDPGGYLLVRSP